MPLTDGRITSRQICVGAITERTIADGSVTGGKLADGAIDGLDIFGSGLRPVQIVDVLPTDPTPTDGDLAFLTTNGKLYRYTGGAWTVAVDGTDIVDGSIVASDKIQANSITASEIEANTITAGQIAAGAISADEIASNAVTADKINVTSLDAITATMGDLSIDSTLRITTGDFVSGPSTGQRLVIGVTATDLSTIAWLKASSSDVRAEIAVGTGTHASIALLAASDTSPSASSSVFTVAAGSTWGNGYADLYVGLRNQSANVVWYGPEGTTSAPGYSFTNDPDTGISRSATNVLSVSVGGDEVFRFQADSSSLVSSGARGTLALQQTTLSTTAGTDITTFSVGGPSGENNVYLDVGQLRHTAGTSWVNMAMFIRRRTDATEQAGLYFDQNAIGINISDPTSLGAGGYRLAVNGPVAVVPSTTGSTSAGYWASASGSYYQWMRNTSTRRHKFDIDYGDEWEARFANATLPRITRHGRVDAANKDDRYFGMIAEDLLDMNPGPVGEALVNRDDDGLVESPDIMQMVYVLAAKVKRMERQLQEATA